MPAAICGRGAKKDRASADCKFCDTDFVGTDGEAGGRYATAGDLAAACLSAAGQAKPDLVVLTGGEPMLQVDAELIEALHARSFTIAIETNGTLTVPAGDRLDLRQPQGRDGVKQRSGDELKVVYPQADLDLPALAGLDFANRFLQPMDGPEIKENTAAAVAYCKAHPIWRLSVQTHKVVGIP